MRSGCISLGDVQCDDCHRTIACSERYLAIEETEGITLRLCLDCCLKQGYAGYKMERGETVLTFFTGQSTG